MCIRDSNTGVKAAAAIGGLADGRSEAAMLPGLGAMGMKGMACLPISKQLDPVIGMDIHLVCFNQRLDFLPKT